MTLCSRETLAPEPSTRARARAHGLGQDEPDRKIGGVFVTHPPRNTDPPQRKCGQSPRGAAPMAHLHRPQHTTLVVWHYLFSIAFNCRHYLTVFASMSATQTRFCRCHFRRRGLCSQYRAGFVGFLWLNSANGLKFVP